MNNFPRYDSYKGSGVDWLGDIPEHWEVIKIKRLFFEKKKSNNIELNCGSISFGKVVLKDDEKVPHSTKKSYQVVSKGDFLVNPLNLNYDLISLRIALSELDVVVSSGYIVLDTWVKLNKDYFKWLLHRFDVAYMKVLGSGVRQTLNYTDIGNSDLVFPPLSEQTAIAEFLDRKTAQVEQAIAQKERLIELLKERRQILIHKAVTRGLNPNVKLKHSSVEWLGEVPEHWELKKLKYVVKIVKRIAGKLGFDVLSITQKGIKIKDIESGEGQLSMDYSKYQLVYIGDFAMNHMDLLTGFVDISKFDGVISPDYRVFNLKIADFDEEYLLFLFQMGYLNKIFYAYGQGVSLLGRWRFPAENFNNFVIPLPPKSEQTAISNFIKSASAKIETAISCKQKEIKKLKEYKAVLINSAVTGKIKISDN